jgi:hypothetical protein
MENLSTLEIVGIIVLVIIFGGFIWNVAKSLFKVFIVGIVIFGAIYFFKPELLNDWFGAGTTAKIEQTIDDADKVVEKIEPYAKGAKEYLEDSLDTK